MFNSIVVGFDGSIHSSRGLEVAAELAAWNQAKLGIIYVVDDAHLGIPDSIREMTEIEHIIEPMPKLKVTLENAPAPVVRNLAEANAESERAMFQYADFLVGQASEIAHESGVSEIETRVKLGNPAEEIAAFASERDADLVVTGNRGFGKVKSFLLGSTSNKVAQLVECSCLTIK